MPESKNIVLCIDGKYRWKYEYDMRRNPMMFISLFKYFFFMLVGVWILYSLIESGSDLISSLVYHAKAMMYPAIFLFVALICMYTFVGSIYHFRYPAYFEMDENGICCVQKGEEFDKMVKNIQERSLAETGKKKTINNRNYTEFSRITKIKSYRKFNTINLHYSISTVAVNAEDEDFDFVLDYLKEHCKNAK